MGLLSRIKAAFRDDCCCECKQVMDVSFKQLFALPDQMVGHYVQHDQPNYYKTHLVKITKKADVPTGMYACGMHVYRCTNCGHKAVKLTIFLPVRNEEKVEQVLLFNHGEMDDFVLKTRTEDR